VTELSPEDWGNAYQRKYELYKDPLTEITDLVGIRIITYYLEDVGRVGDILKGEFEIDEANSVDKSEALDPDKFGYASVHYIVGLPADRQRLAGWRHFRDIRAEIQVRTALQHAWSAVNHKLDYKSPTEFPRELRRSLFRLSALFELADEQFSELRDARNRIAAEYAADVRSGQLDIPLDEASVAAYIDDCGKREPIEKMIRAGGGTVVPSTRHRVLRPLRLQRRGRADHADPGRQAGRREHLQPYLCG